MKKRASLTTDEKEFIETWMGRYDLGQLAVALNVPYMEVWRYARTLPGFENRKYKPGEKQQRQKVERVKDHRPPPKRTDDWRPKSEYSNRSPYGIASPGIQKP